MMATAAALFSRNHKAKARNSRHAELILTAGLNQIKQTL